MKITDTAPDEIVNVLRYQADLQDGQYHRLEEFRDMVGETICTRLIVNRYNDRDEDFAGDYMLEIVDLVEPKSRRKMQPGIMKILLAAPVETQATSSKSKPNEYYVSPSGLLLPTGRLKWMLYGHEDGYFPVNNDGWDEAFGELVSISPPAEPLVHA